MTVSVELYASENSRSQVGQELFDELGWPDCQLHRQGSIGNQPQRHSSPSIVSNARGGFHSVNLPVMSATEDPDFVALVAVGVYCVDNLIVVSGVG